MAVIPARVPGQILIGQCGSCAFPWINGCDWAIGHPDWPAWVGGRAKSSIAPQINEIKDGFSGVRCHLQGAP